MRKLTTTMKVLMLLAVFIWPAMNVSGQIVISQYIETNSGTAPKGIELWNTSASTIDFSVTNLDILKGANGGTPATDILINTGTLAPDGVIVVGTSNLSPDYEYGFSFNGDDALVIQLGGVTVDVFGDPGTGDPGAGWDGNGVQTYNQNIQLKTGITTGDTDGWTDPSERFEIVSTDPINDMTGFGDAPTTGGAPDVEPSNHVTAFSASNDDPNTITLTWTDNDGAQAASAFLLKANTGAITAPIDATAEVDDTDLSDGAAIVNVAHGVETYVFAGLPSGETYNFEIYPYTNSGADIDFKTDGTVPSTTGSTTAAVLPTKLVITSVTPASPYTGQLFEVVVEAQDASDIAQNVDQDTDVELNLAIGTGSVSGTTTGTITTGSNSFTFSNLTYDAIETMEVNVSANAGMALTTSVNESIVVTAAPVMPDVFFSEYSEANGGNNKYVEVYNGTGIEINLTGFVVKLAANGGDWGNTHELTGTLAAGDVYVIANANAEQAILDVADATSDITYFNGDDAVGLFVNDALIDIIGIQGVDPGSGWDVAGITEATANHTLVRKYGVVTTGNTDWTASAGTDEATSEWDVNEWDDYSNLGSHEAPVISPEITAITVTPDAPLSSESISVSANVTDADGIVSTVTLNWGIISGDLSTAINMTASGDVYTTDTDIPAQADGTTVYYNIVADDNDLNVTTTSEMMIIVNDPATATVPYSNTFDTDLGNMYTYSVLGDTKVWYHNNGAANINGYNSGETEEDWMIFPALDLSAKANEVLTFETSYNYGSDDANNYFKLMYSDDYTGIGDPSSATWNELTYTQPSASSTWTGSGNVDLSTITGASVHIAFKYHYEAGSYKTWAVDNIAIDAVQAVPIIANISATPAAPMSTDIVTITADVTDADGTIDAVELHYGLVSGAYTDMIAMTITAGDTYTGEIPAMADGTVVYYQIVATDNEMNETLSIEQSYTVVNEAIKLAITANNPVEPYIGQAFTVTVNSQDINGSASPADMDTEILIELATGTGVISGTYTGTISMNESSVTIGDLMYDVAENIEISASVTSGMVLTASATYSITIGDTPAEPIVFFSEYSEADGGNNKYVEVYNATGEDIDLTGIVVKLASNGGDWGNTHELTGTLADGGVYLIANSSADQGILDIADATSSITYFNGNDALGLFVNDVLVDAIGIQGVNPGDNSGWDVAGITEATANHTLVRKYGDVTVGNTDWALSAGTDEATSEWIVLDWNNYSNAGSHVAIPSTPVISSIAFIPVNPTMEDLVSVSAMITDSDATLTSVELQYGFTTGTYTSTVTMVNESGNSYIGEIPAQALGTTVYFVIAAEDENGIVYSDEQSYTVIEAGGNQVANIAALRIGATDGTVYELTGEAVLTFQRAARNQKYIEDVTGAILIDDNAGVITTVYNQYDGITGVTGTLSPYNGLLQFVPTLDPGAATSENNVVIPQVVAITDVAGAVDTYESELITFENVTFADAGGTFATNTNYELSDGTNTINLRTSFSSADYIGTTIPSGSLNITALVAEYNGTAQIYARDAADIVSLNPTISNITALPVEPSSTEDVTVTAEVIDGNGTIATVNLNWGVATGELTNTVAMTATVDTYTGVIPAQADETTVYYQIVATDNDANETASVEMTYNVVDYDIATQLSIVSVNPVSPYIGQTFSIEIHALDVNDEVGIVSEDTEIQVNLATGTGTITGTVTGTILNGTSSVTISGLTYDVVETIMVNASTVSGMSLTTSADYEIVVTEMPDVPMVFISEYSEADGGNNKYVEIYNGTGIELDLTGFAVKLAANGADWGNTHELIGILAAGDVYVIANASAEQAILDVADATSDITYFNGDDAIGLFANDVLIDAIGIQGVDPGAGWDVAGITEATANHTLVRKYPDVVLGNTDWTLSAGTDEASSEWVVNEWNDYSGLGWHGEAPEEPVIANVSIAPVMPTSDDAVSVSADVTSPIGTISTVTLNWGTVSGILDQTVTMNVGTAPSYVTDTDIPAQVDGTVVYYTITAIDNAALETVTNEMSYTVNDPSVVALPYSHDFTDNNFGELVTYSVVGDQVWEVTTYGNPAPGAKVTGYSGQNYANEDWMITPGLDFSTVTEAKLIFDEAINYADDVNNEMPIMVSTDYEGTGDPSLATWTALDVTGRSTGDNWTFVTVNDVDLTAYANEAVVYIGFKYTSTTTSGATWEVDNIVVEEGGALIAPVIDNIAINPAEPTTSDAVTVSATITDANGTVETAVLHWGTDVFYGNTINMAIESADTWVAETDIPAQANNTQIFYKIMATDNESNETTSDDMTYYSFDPYEGELPYYEPFYYGLGTMNETSIVGTQTWRWDEYGYAKVSGYSGGAQENEDWLITPSFDFSNVSSAVLNFREAINFAVNIADEQKVMISTDYDGTSAPSTATWTELTITNRPAGDSWSFVSVDEVDLADYVGETSVSIGFKYISTTAGAATWEIDEVSVSEGDGIIFNSANQVTVYPNPAHDELFISGAANGQISIITLDGKVVMSEQTTDNSINVSNLNDGLYIVRVISGNEVFTTRFVKK